MSNVTDDLTVDARISVEGTIAEVLVDGATFPYPPILFHNGRAQAVLEGLAVDAGGDLVIEVVRGA
ncbi:MAG: hypothetical protein M5R36_12055 [Deltaproteobacteria bacterium]|nr:hypothetical protein [Deltaproteobacteria bacterium]